MGDGPKVVTTGDHQSANCNAFIDHSMTEAKQYVKRDPLLAGRIEPLENVTQT